MKDISNFNWIKQTETNRYEMVLDHHMLATWRSCQAHFQHLHMEGRRPKNGYSWSLEFGILMHEIVQKIYDWKDANDFTFEKVSYIAAKMWDEANMDKFKDHPTSKSLGGKMGFIALCLQYVNYYTSDTERLRIIGTEIGFGSNKEVPLGFFNHMQPLYSDEQLFFQNTTVEKIRIDCYLSGRIDFLADDGNKIGPLDHKTRAAFGKKDLGAAYSPHDGMTGYIYATRHILNHRFPAMAEKRKCNTAWMNFIQVSNEPDMMKRFKRSLVMRTDWQLEEYRERQIETFREIFQYLFYDRRPQWNTEACTHWYGVDCIYQKVHRLPDAASQLVVLTNDFTSGQFWNPEKDDMEEGGSNGKSVSGNIANDTATVQEQGI